MSNAAAVPDVPELAFNVGPDTVVTSESPVDPSTNSMDEFYRLKNELQIITFVIGIVIFGFVWFFYSLNIALNYLLGACTSVVYLRLLARNVEQIGGQKQSIGRSQVAIFIGLIIIATQWNQLKVLPVFLGFLTYKATLLIFVFRSLLPSHSSS